MGYLMARHGVWLAVMFVFIALFGVPIVLCVICCDMRLRL